MTAYRKMILATAITVAGCASTPPLTTASGNPEVIIHGKSQQEVSDLVATMCANEGRTIASQTATTVTCSKTVTDVMMQALTGPSQGTTQYAITKQGGAVRVMMSSAWLESTNGFGAVTRHPVDIRQGKLANTFQNGLNKMAESANGASK